VLEEMRSTIHAVAPEATESISYAIPTFDLNGRHLVHFAAFKNHIGFYPVPSALEAFKEELKAYKSGKGSAQFPHGKPLPLDLIRRIGNVDEPEMYRTFNMGIGMVAICGPDKAGAMRAALEACGETVYEIGRIEGDCEKVRLV
jgi:uncharacterized protein YdhG (YjbR/CyaY superfamily)